MGAAALDRDDEIGVPFAVVFECNGVVSIDSDSASLSTTGAVVLMYRLACLLSRMIEHPCSLRAKQLMLGILAVAMVCVIDAGCMFEWNIFLKP